MGFNGFRHSVAVGIVVNGCTLLVGVVVDLLLFCVSCALLRARLFFSAFLVSPFTFGWMVGIFVMVKKQLDTKIYAPIYMT